MPSSGGRPTDDPLYRGIMAVMVASVMAGTLLAVAGEYHFDSPAMKQVGVAAVLISGAIYFVFRWLGHRALQRQIKDARPPDREGPGPE